MPSIIRVLLPCGLAVAALAATAQEIVLQDVALGLSRVVDISHAGDGSGRLFLTQQSGAIRVLRDGNLLAAPFLNLQGLVSTGGEQGLLGVAFHPAYASNGFFYVHYTNTAGDSVLARYSVSGTNPDLADPASAAILLTVDQPYENHNGGQLAFGPDGYLYMALGDGGSGGDPENRAQNLGTLLGKILRLDVNGGSPYAIPPTNPFVATPGALPEIWAYGLRNPWRFSFDRATGDLFIGDVGQGAWEEIDFQPAGAGGRNYGWRRMEGAHCYNPSSGCNTGTLTLPILEYPHSNGGVFVGCSVTGGYRYRGVAHPDLFGKYLYGDYCTGRIWGAVETAGTWSATQSFVAPILISAFGEDENGEVYVAQLGNNSFWRAGVYRVIGVQGLAALSVNTFAAAEGTGGNTIREFTVSLSQARDEPVSVQYQLGGTATPGVDYQTQPASGILTFAPGQIARTLAISVIGDALGEVPETVTLDLTAATGATIAVARGTLTIQDDDPLPVLSIVASAAHLEGESAPFQIVLTGAWGSTVQANFATENVTATAGQDYVAKSGSVTFAPGSGEQRVSDFVSVTEDGVREPVEFLRLRLSGVVGATLSAETLEIAIVDDDYSWPSDFDGNHTSDLLWRNAATGNLYEWQMLGVGVGANGSVGTVADASWTIEGLADLDGDGRADILWHNVATGDVYAWLMNGLAKASEGAIGRVGDLQWQIQGTGDVDGDGRADILWRHGTTGAVYVWLMDGLSIKALGGVAVVDDMAWQIAGLADLDGDTKTDIVWRHGASGGVYGWLMDGLAKEAEGWIDTVADPGWQIQGLGDLDADGKADIVWRHAATGQLHGWLMNGLARRSDGSMGSAGDLGWKIRRFGDYNGDGKTDILWRHDTTGAVYVWLMNGFARIAEGGLGTVADPAWQIVSVVP